MMALGRLLSLSPSMLINKQEEHHHRTPEPRDSPFSNSGKAEEALVLNKKRKPYMR